MNRYQKTIYPVGFILQRTTELEKPMLHLHKKESALILEVKWLLVFKLDCMKKPLPFAQMLVMLAEGHIFHPK